MNFKTKKSAGNGMVFVDKYDRSVETNFSDVSYNYDNYVLAKRNNSAFYAVLDLDGRETDEKINVVHRFENGLLLTYKPFTKQYRSSDNFTYDVNYNVYSVYNFDTKNEAVVCIIQSDNILNLKRIPLVQKIKSFMDKTIYAFDNFIFSEIFGDSLLITATHFNIPAMAGSAKKEDIFETFSSKKVWNIADLTACSAFNGETSIDVLLSSRIFKEVEYTLYTLVNFSQQKETAPCVEECANVEKSKAEVQEKPVASLKKNPEKIRKNKWQMLFGGKVAFSFN
jgi:hypothetical protein